ncbi:hypothetical protein WJX74_009547 [Apatococcus lobatus]|uniref:Uncharacterized protein n=1 Tax=Apatococcus lobatus TaxID=904363 RepID=A0AAW1SFG2_9CHLO
MAGSPCPECKRTECAAGAETDTVDNHLSNDRQQRSIRKVLRRIETGRYQQPPSPLLSANFHDKPPVKAWLQNLQPCRVTRMMLSFFTLFTLCVTHGTLAAPPISVTSGQVTRNGVCEGQRGRDQRANLRSQPFDPDAPPTHPVCLANTLTPIFNGRGQQADQCLEVSNPAVNCNVVAYGDSETCQGASTSVYMQTDGSGPFQGSHLSVLVACVPNGKKAGDEYVRSLVDEAAWRNFQTQNKAAWFGSGFRKRSLDGAIGTTTKPPAGCTNAGSYNDSCHAIMVFATVAGVVPPACPAFVVCRNQVSMLNAYARPGCNDIGYNGAVYCNSGIARFDPTGQPMVNASNSDCQSAVNVFSTKAKGNANCQAGAEPWKASGNAMSCYSYQNNGTCTLQVCVAPPIPKSNPTVKCDEIIAAAQKILQDAGKGSVGGYTNLTSVQGGVRLGTACGDCAQVPSPPLVNTPASPSPHPSPSPPSKGDTCDPKAGEPCGGTYTCQNKDPHPTSVTVGPYQCDTCKKPNLSCFLPKEKRKIREFQIHVILNCVMSKTK